MPPRTPSSKILDRDTIVEERLRLREAGQTLVFTNGCFDILHAGHVDYLSFARSQGDALVVAINSDDSVRKNKGDSRPLVTQDDRALVLAALESVDYVVVFEEDEPVDLISAILPDILVKGEDWSHYVAGREVVEQNGGRVVLAKFMPGRSTTSIIDRIRGS